MNDPLTQVLDATVYAAVERALATSYRPVYAVSRKEAARRLGCSVSTISNLIDDGVLSYVPRTKAIPVGQLRRLGEMDEFPSQAAAVDLDALDRAS